MMNENSEKCSVGKDRNHIWTGNLVTRNMVDVRTIGTITIHTCANCLAMKVDYDWVEKDENGEWPTREATVMLKDPR